MSTGKTIAKYRKKNGLTQEQLADLINVSRQTIATWETSWQFPSDTVAILAARFLNLNEADLLNQLHWDKLRQRVDDLQERYNATITVERTKEEQEMDVNLRDKMTQTISGITLRLTRIFKTQVCKPIYWDKEFEHSHGVFHTAWYPCGYLSEDTEEKLVLYILRENRNPKILLHGTRAYIEDNLGNQSQRHHSGSMGSGESFGYGFFSCNYTPEATSFTYYRDYVNRHEDDCDVLFFENVPLAGRKISKTFDGITVTYNGFDSDQRAIHTVHDKPREVRHVGITEVIDNLGNLYKLSGGGSSGPYDDSIGGYLEHYGLKDLHPEATSISFKYLFARTILSFEFSDLPLPS